MEGIPLEGRPWSLLMNYKIWDRVGRWYINGSATWGIRLFLQSESGGSKVWIYEDRKWTNSGYYSSLSVHLSNLLEKATRGYNTSHCNNLPLFVAGNL